MLRFVHRLLPVFLVSLMACSGDDPTGPGTGSGDQTPPSVARYTPGPDWVDVQGNQRIVIEFDEPMDQRTAETAVRLSTPDSLEHTVTLSWPDPKTLWIDHGWLRFGSWATVLVSADLKDRAGNALATPLEWNFGVAPSSSSFLFLGSRPGDRDTGIPTNTQILLVFNRALDPESLKQELRLNTTIDGTPAILPFWIHEAGFGKVVLVPEEPLPPNSTIEVLTRAGAPSSDGELTDTARATRFETGGSVDSTPPALIDVRPSLLDPLAASARNIQLVFSEPIDELSFGIPRMSQQLAVAVVAGELKPYWSANSTVWTLPLPSDLPSGLPVVLGLTTIVDRAGNTVDEPVELRTVVEGVEQPIPFDLPYELWYLAQSIVREGSGSSAFEELRVVRGERLDANRLRLLDLNPYEPSETVGSEDFLHIGGRILRTGRTIMSESSTSTTSLSPGLELVRQPYSFGSVTDSTDATIDGQAVKIVYSTTSLGREDLSTGISTSVLVPDPVHSFEIDGSWEWADVWKTRVEYKIYVGDAQVGEGTETTWFSPPIGRIQTETFDRDLVSGREVERRETLTTVKVPE